MAQKRAPLFSTDLREWIRAIIDACRPFEWIDEFPHVAEADPAYLGEIKAKWPSVFEGR